MRLRFKIVEHATPNDAMMTVPYICQSLLLYNDLQQMYINRSNQMSHLADGACPNNPVVVCGLELVGVARPTSYTKVIRPIIAILLRSQVVHRQDCRNAGCLSIGKALWIGIASFKSGHARNWSLSHRSCDFALYQANCV